MNTAALYKRLGFGPCKALPPNTGQKGCEYGHGEMVLFIPWKDRLRLLVSGRMMVAMAHMMDRQPKVWETTATHSVLPPE